MTPPEMQRKAIFAHLETIMETCDPKVAREVLAECGLCVPSPTERVVPLNLLARAREHVPYMGETWKELTAAMADARGVKASHAPQTCRNYGSPGGLCPSHPFCGCFPSGGKA